MKNASNTLMRLLEDWWDLAHDSSDRGAARLVALNQRIVRRYERTVAPFAHDMAGFTRLTMDRGIIHYLSMINRMTKLCAPLVKRAMGKVVKQEADNLFAYFPAVENAVRAALSIQKALDEVSRTMADEFALHTSIGIGYGPVLLIRGDMWGAEFNLVSKLAEDIAGRDEILLTEAARSALSGGKYGLQERAVVLGGMPVSAYQLIPNPVGQ